jgi:hypothetical protein
MTNDASALPQSRSGRSCDRLNHRDDFSSLEREAQSLLAIEDGPRSLVESNRVSLGLFSLSSQNHSPYFAQLQGYGVPVSR